MAEIVIIRDIFDAESIESIVVNENADLRKLLDEKKLVDTSKEIVEETYNATTGKTERKSKVESFNIKVYVNNEEKDLDYKCSNEDSVVIMLLPMSGGISKFNSLSIWKRNWIAGGTMIAGAVAGIGLVAFSVVTAGVGLGIIAAGLSIGALLLSISEPEQKNNSVSSENDPNGAEAPTIAGASNSPILNNSIPAIIGNYRVSPFLGASTYTTLDPKDKMGRTQYITALYVLGYAPLIPTDFRFESLPFATNEREYKDKDGKTKKKIVVDGILNNAKGDIGDKWKNNDIQLEIKQLGDYPSLYPYTVKEEKVDAALLYCYDKKYSDVEQEYKISWGGKIFPCGFKTNTIHISKEVPRRLEVDIDFPNGLYASRSETRDDNSATYYHKIDLNLAIQWRVRTKNTTGTTSAFNSGTDDIRLSAQLGSSGSTNNESGTDEGWHSFDGITNGDDISTRWSRLLSDREVSNNEGVSSDGGNTNPYWNGAKVFNFGHYSCGYYSSDLETSGIKYTKQDKARWKKLDDDFYPKNEMRFTAYADIPDKVIRQLLKMNEDNTDSVIQGLEVRVIRLTPCYVDGIESKSDVNQGPANYADIVKWTTLRTFSYDADMLLHGGKNGTEDVKAWDGSTKLTETYYQRPYSFDDMSKICVAALKVKTDNLQVISGSIEKMSVMLNAVTPKWSEEEHKWFPENIKRTKMYHCVSYDSKENIKEVKDFHQKDYGNNTLWENAKNNFKKQQIEKGYTVDSFWENDGNDWWFNMKQIMKTILVENGDFLVNEDFIKKYTANNAMSSLLLSAIGLHLGKDAYGYEAFNMGQLSESWVCNEHMSDGYLTDKQFGANAYLYQSKKLSDVFIQILLAGRAYICTDELNRWEVHVDMPQENPIEILNQENVINSSNTRSYKESLAGYRFTFVDENDDYYKNTLYAMKDGENRFHPSRDIQQLNMYEYVTNGEQYHSLARYNLASNIMQREVWTRTVGPIGYKLKIGSLVHDAHTSILVGTDYGGRIEELIEDDNYIYGFNTDKPYRYTAEFNDDLTNKLGVEIFQNGTGVQQSYCTMKLIGKEGLYIPIKDGMPNSDGTPVLYQMTEEYITNSVLFASPIQKTTGKPVDESYAASAVMVYNPKVGDIVAFGYIGEITVPALVLSIKSEKNHKFTLTLVPYEEGVYKAGKKLPVYKTHMTSRDSSASMIGSDYTVQNVIPIGASANDIENLREELYDLTTNNNGEKTKPDNVSNLRAVAGQDSIEISWDSYTVKTGLNNSISFFTVEIAKDGDNFENLESVSSSSFSYVFDRDIDGYPEKSDLSIWKFRVKATNVYGLESEGYTVCTVNLDTYGTWIPPILNTSKWDAVASQDEITLNSTFTLDTSMTYYGLPFTAVYEYSSDGVSNWRRFVSSTGYKFFFDRKIDGYPEKSDLSQAKVRAYFISSVGIFRKDGNGNKEYSIKLVNLDTYGTWIPVVRTLPESNGNAPVRVSVNHRGVTFTGSQPANRNVYGDIQYGISVCKPESDGNNFYTPDIESDPYASIDAYKKADESEPHWVSRNMNQIMPLSGQDGAMWKLDQYKKKTIVNALNEYETVTYAAKTSYIPVDKLNSAKDYYDASLISKFIPNHIDVKNLIKNETYGTWFRDKVDETTYVKDDGSLDFDDKKKYFRKMEGLVIKLDDENLLALDSSTAALLFERSKN